MKKRIVAVALAAAMLASLAGCGKSVKVELGEYKDMPLKSVTDEDFQAKIDTYVKQNFVEDREVEGPVEDGDTAYINYVGKKDGVAFEGGTDDSEEGYPLTIGSHAFIEGFEDGLVGAKAGQNLDLNLTFPESYGNADLAGADVVFNVTVKKITREFPVELTDASVKEKLGYDSVQAFYDTVRKDLNFETYSNQIAESLTASSSVKNLPEDEVNEYCESVYSYAKQTVQSYAQMYGADEVTILKLMLGFDSYDALHDYCLEGATSNVTYQYIIKEIAKKEGIKVTDEVLRERGAEYADHYGYDTVDQLIENAGEDAVRDSIQMDLTIQFIIDNAKIF